MKTSNNIQELKMNHTNDIEKQHHETRRNRATYLNKGRLVNIGGIVSLKMNHENSNICRSDSVNSRRLT